VAAAIHGADHAMNAHVAGLAIHADFRNFGDKTPERFHDGDAARHPSSGTGLQKIAAVYKGSIRHGTPR
jgi:hypothetical protein